MALGGTRTTQTPNLPVVYTPPGLPAVVQQQPAQVAPAQPGQAGVRAHLDKFFDTNKDRRITVPETFNGLRRLDLSACPAVDDAALAAVAGVVGLGWLDLWGCRRFGADGLARLSGSGLVSLRLAGCAQLDAAAWPHLAGLPELVALDLAGCSALTPAGLRALSELPALGYLDLRGCSRLDDEACATLARLPELTVLNLSLCPGITLRGLQALQPAGGDDRVGIEQHHIVGASIDAAIDRADETQIAIVAQTSMRHRKSR